MYPSLFSFFTFSPQLQPSVALLFTCPSASFDPAKGKCFAFKVNFMCIFHLLTMQVFLCLFFFFAKMQCKTLKARYVATRLRVRWGAMHRGKAHESTRGKSDIAARKTGVVCLEIDRGKKGQRSFNVGKADVASWI